MSGPATPAAQHDLARRYVLLALLAPIAIIALQALVLHGLGRSAICTCGVVKLWHANPNSSENSQHIADWYTPSHIVHGLLFYFIAWLVMRRAPVAWRLVAATLVEAGWEVLENTDLIINRYREGTISLNYYGDSILNSVFDTLWMITGFVLAWRLPVFAGVALVLALEIAAAYVIRDNLTLNVIMLLYPLESIRAWQAALPPP